MIFYYVRHGDPIYKPNQLTELGKLQTSAAAKRLARYGIDMVYSSPSNRAQQTAQPLCDITKKTMNLLDWTDEKHAWRELIMAYSNDLHIYEEGLPTKFQNRIYI